MQTLNRIQRLSPFALFFGALLCGANVSAHGGDAANPEDSLLFLRNEHAEVGILPSVGGRIVVYRRPGGRNLLDSDPAKWVEPLVPVRPQSGFAHHRGHEVWLSPQHLWWNQQTLIPGRRDAPWPPDPYLTRAPFEIVERSPNGIVMEGPVSPINFVRLRTEIELRDDGLLRFRAVLRNEGTETVRWGLWTVTRVPPEADVYVPIVERGLFRVDFATQRPMEGRPLPYSVEHSIFYFQNTPPPDGISVHGAKAFMQPAAGWIAAFVGDNVLMKRAITSQEGVHRMQAPVEIYCYRNENGQGDLLELEFHGPQVELAPGAATAFEETWEMFRYTGEAMHAERLEFVKDLRDK